MLICGLKNDGISVKRDMGGRVGVFPYLSNHFKQEAALSYAKEKAYCVTKSG